MTKDIDEVASDLDIENQEAEEDIKTDIEDSDGSSLKDMALSTEPSKPLDQVESPFNPEKGGMSRVMRSIQKMTDKENIPAIFDLILGLIEFFVSYQSPGQQEETQQEEIFTGER